jgi:hypothetical protein
MPLIL